LPGGRLCAAHIADELSRDFADAGPFTEGTIAAGLDLFEIVFSTKLCFQEATNWLIQLPLRELKKALSETVGETSEVAVIER